MMSQIHNIVIEMLLSGVEKSSNLIQSKSQRGKFLYQSSKGF